MNGKIIFYINDEDSSIILKLMRKALKDTEFYYAQSITKENGQEFYIIKKEKIKNG